MLLRQELTLEQTQQLQKTEQPPTPEQTQQPQPEQPPEPQPFLAPAFPGMLLFWGFQVLAPTAHRSQWSEYRVCVYTQQNTLYSRVQHGFISDVWGAKHLGSGELERLAMTEARVGLFERRQLIAHEFVVARELAWLISTSALAILALALPVFVSS